MLKYVTRGLAAFAGVYALACGGLYWAMTQPPEVIGRVMADVPQPLRAALPFRPFWSSARAGRLEVGDPAPDFALNAYDKSGIVRLSDFRGDRPVLLVFGSYT